MSYTRRNLQFLRLEKFPRAAKTLESQVAAGPMPELVVKIIEKFIITDPNQEDTIKQQGREVAWLTMTIASLESALSETRRNEFAAKEEATTRIDLCY